MNTSEFKNTRKLKNEKEDLKSLIDGLFLNHDQIEEIVYKTGQIYLTPSQIFKMWLSALKYKITGRF